MGNSCFYAKIHLSFTFSFNQRHKNEFIGVIYLFFLNLFYGKKMAIIITTHLAGHLRQHRLPGRSHERGRQQVPMTEASQGRSVRTRLWGQNAVFSILHSTILYAVLIVALSVLWITIVSCFFFCLDILTRNVCCLYICCLYVWISNYECLLSIVIMIC